MVEIRGAFELEFMNRLQFFSPIQRKTICNIFILRRSLMEDDYKTIIPDMIHLKLNK